MEHSPVMKSLMMVSWFVTAIVSINMLTGMYDYNLILYIGNMAPGLVIPLMWIIGLLGIFSLGVFIKMCAMGCPRCGSCPCKCETCNCK